jgi:hypothetical protein
LLNLFAIKLRKLGEPRVDAIVSIGAAFEKEDCGHELVEHAVEKQGLGFVAQDYAL